jgi:hypothetical protein
LIDRTFVSVGVRFKKNEIRPLDEHAHGRPNVWAAAAKPGVLGQLVNPCADGTDHSRCGGRIIGGDRQPDVFQVALCGW